MINNLSTFYLNSWTSDRLPGFYQQVLRELKWMLFTHNLQLGHKQIISFNVCTSCQTPKVFIEVAEPAGHSLL